MRTIERTLIWIRKNGGLADICERWLQFAHCRKDLFGFADIIRLDKNIIAIQCCTLTNRAQEKRKIIQNPSAKAWLMAGGEIEIWAWRKSNVRWLPEVTKILIDDMEV